MFKFIGDTFGAFFSNPLKFIIEPANTTLEYQTKKMAAEGKSEAQIEEELKGAGLLPGAGPVKVVIDTVGKTLELLLRYLPLILLGLGVIIILSYLRSFKVIK